MPDVLNPDLYNRLVQRFGTVKIHNQGEAMCCTWLSSFGSGEWVITQWGENYTVNCFICGDTRQRLCINHRWGIGAPGGNDDNKFWNLVVCYNENCEKTHGFYNELRQRVYGLQRPIANIPIGTATPVQSSQAVELPGLTVSLSELPDNHAAIRYLIEDRKFDPYYLAKMYGLGYCYSSEQYPIAMGRIIIPVYNEVNTLKGWQARYVGSANWKLTPKYYSMPGGNNWINSTLYNFDKIQDNSIIILTEGVFDTIRLDAPGTVALFGKDLKPGQVKLVQPFETVVVLLDGATQKESRRICGQLQNKNVVNVQLPSADKDPGDMEREELFELIWDSMEKQGVEFGVININ